MRCERKRKAHELSTLEERPSRDMIATSIFLGDPGDINVDEVFEITKNFILRGHKKLDKKRVRKDMRKIFTA